MLCNCPYETFSTPLVVVRKTFKLLLRFTDLLYICKDRVLRNCRYKLC